MKVVLIDDEPNGLWVLQTLLTDYCPEVQIMGTANSATEGLKVIQQYQPDLVFLDIEMPNYSGFQLLDFLQPINFEIIFVTAHAGYALDAFKVHASDYILKPIQIDELQNAVKRVVLKKGADASKQLVIHQQGIIHCVSFEDIIFIQAEGSYSFIYLKNQPKIIVSKRLKELEADLTEKAGFFRCHRSYIVNTQFIKSVKVDGNLKLISDHEIAVARDKRNELKKILHAII